MDCSGYNGRCVDGICDCNPGWQGRGCGQVKFERNSAARAFQSALWTWGGSPIYGDDGLIHLFASQITNFCGIKHYCSNSQIVHLVSKQPQGPFEFSDIALAPRDKPYWDSGATHGVTVHRLLENQDPHGAKFALYYMGTYHSWDTKDHPNCTIKYDHQEGDRASRRIGIATSRSLYGPWKRREEPIFGPGNKTAGEWDWLDVSNPTPILLRNGSCILLYKGRGEIQAVGVAVAPRFDGPFQRLNLTGVVPGEDPWAWIETTRAGQDVFHAFSHEGNGNSSAGVHSWSADGIHWMWEFHAYTGEAQWANGSTSILSRRERPQVLFAMTNETKPTSSYGTPEVLFTSAEHQICTQGGGLNISSACVSFTMSEKIDLTRKT